MSVADLSKVAATFSLVAALAACSTPGPGSTDSLDYQDGSRSQVAASAPCSTPCPRSIDSLDYQGGSLSLAQRGDACELKLKGAINSDTVRKLSALLSDLDTRQCSRRSIALDADDGTINNAITLGAMLRNRNFDTVVLDGSACRTACALVFASGRERILPGNATTPRIGFQQIPSAKDIGRQLCETELNRAQTLTLGRYLHAMLPPPAAKAMYEKLVSADCRRIQYVAANEAIGMGLATRAQR